MSLTIAAIEKAQPGITPDGRTTAKSYKMGDSSGLYLLVSRAGGKWWRLKYRFGGRERGLSLGVYPDVSLTEARQARDSYRAMLATGVDPGEHVKMLRASRMADAARQIAATRFTLDDKGALSFRFGNRRLCLTPEETSALRGFLDTTRSVAREVTPCP